MTHDSLLIHVMSCTQEQFAAAVDLDRRGPKRRLDTSRQGYLSGVPEGIARTAVTTSRTCSPPPNAAASAELHRAHGRYIYHGTHVHREIL